MCFAQTHGQQYAGLQPGATAEQKAVTAAIGAPQAAAAVESGGPAATLKRRSNQLNAYDGFNTDIVGASMAAKQAPNDNSPRGALKKLMGA